MVKFAIVGMRRTGTTLIRTTLNAHPDIYCIGEAYNFGPRFGKGARGDTCEGGYRQFINSIPFGRTRDLVMRRAMVRAHLDQLYSKPGFKALGFKLMHSQSDAFPQVLEYLHDHNVSIIHIVRRNVLKTLISRTVKTARGASHTKTAVKTTQVELREDRLLKHLGRFERENEAWEIETRGLPYVKVNYEDFVVNKSAELNRMLEFLEVEKVPDLQSDLVKISPDDIRQIVTNYDAVAAILKGTRFEWCLNG